MQKILYLDLGAHKGEEIEMFLTSVGSDYDYKVIALEPNKSLYEDLLQKYAGSYKIEILSHCIGNDESQSLLYEYNNNTQSSSIFSDKINMDQTGNTMEVNMKKLSSIIKGINDLESFSLKILKSNIEGAEFDMLVDLEKSNLFIFDLYLGSGPPPNSILKDMYKFKHLICKIPEAIEIMKRNQIVSHCFSAYDENNPTLNLDMKSFIEDFFKEK
jgi:FkbM family methyltransferase